MTSSQIADWIAETWLRLMFVVGLFVWAALVPVQVVLTLPWWGLTGGFSNWRFQMRVLDSVLSMLPIFKRHDCRNR